MMEKYLTDKKLIVAMIHELQDFIDQEYACFGDVKFEQPPSFNICLLNEGVCCCAGDFSRPPCECPFEHKEI